MIEVAPVLKRVAIKGEGLRSFMADRTIDWVARRAGRGPKCRGQADRKNHQGGVCPQPGESIWNVFHGFSVGVTAHGPIGSP